ncbi:MAG TPA: TolC family protein [Planctomycetota bacterium]|nr:TolC family protein [Planctomycetota bacterium]
MPRPHSLAVLATVVATACHSYSAEPVDLEAHAREFAARALDGASVRQFAERLRSSDPTLPGFDPGDGLTLGEARYAALLFNAELRTIRLRAGVARASAEHAGRWADPELSGDLAKILESVDHPWVTGVSLGLTLPITGRPGLEQELAQSRHAEALVQARVAESRVLNELDESWAQWSVATLGVELLEQLVAQLTDLEAIAARLSAAQLMTRVEARAFALERLTRQSQLLHAKSQQGAAEVDLKTLLGLPPDRAVAFVPSTGVSQHIVDQAQRRGLLADGPRVAIARREHDVSERQLALAVRKQWPELTLLPGWQEEDGQPRAALGFSLPLPLWNGNAREIAETRAAREVAAETLRASFERATQDLARAERRFEAAQTRRRLVDGELVPLAERQVVEGRRLAELGQLDTLLILDAVTRAYEAKATALEAVLAETEATIEINALFWPALAVGDATEPAR